MAERVGFEPTNTLWVLLEFQSSAFDRSATSPGRRSLPDGRRGGNRSGRWRLRALLAIGRRVLEAGAGLRGKLRRLQLGNLERVARVGPVGAGGHAQRLGLLRGLVGPDFSAARVGIRQQAAA